MANTIAGGRPYTRRFTIADGGMSYVLPCRSAELYFNPLSSQIQVWWYENEYLANDTSRCMTLNGGVSSGIVSLRAACDMIWLRGDGAELELTVISRS